MNEQLTDGREARELGNIQAEQLASDLESPSGIEPLNKEDFEQAKRDNSVLREKEFKKELKGDEKL
jgi:hypothetical protein